MVVPTIEPLAMQLPSMLRLEGVKGNAKVRLPERCHIETSMLDGIRLASMVLPVFLGRICAERQPLSPCESRLY